MSANARYLFICCQQVYRCYDNRFRYTSRSDVAYRDVRCKAITEGCEDVLFVPETVMKIDDPNIKNDIWFKKPNDDRKSLNIISTPFRVGGHIAKNPRDFIPIIDKLQALHGEGYIHGDIRACNLIFGDEDGWLIDFDFSREEIQTPVYPNGYATLLTDGLRKGKSGEVMYRWHDWSALGKVIFYVHWISNEDAEASIE